MPAPKSERLLNLVIMLLVQRRPVPKDRIREVLYADSRPDAFEKMFERDKEELRSLGVTIEIAQVDPLFEDEIGYTIPAGTFALPDIELTPEEAAVVGLASRTWQHATVAQAASDAMRKLAVAGVDVDTAALDLAQPLLTVDEPAFETCWQAACDRTEIAFDYQRVGAEPTRRRVQPWGVVRYSGRWYVVGHDLDRGAERVFRLSRVQGEVRLVGPSGAYDVPPGTNVRNIARRLAPQTASERAVLLVRAGTAVGLRRTADRVEPRVAGPDEITEWDRVEIDRPSTSLADEVLAHGADVVVVEPAGVRAQVVARLSAAAGAAR